MFKVTDYAALSRNVVLLCELLLIYTIALVY